MSLAEFQRVIARMYTSPLFLTALKMDLKQSLQNYQLSDSEIEALTQLAYIKPKIEKFSSGLYRKKFYFYWEQFPTLSNFSGLIELEVMTAFQEYYDFEHRGEIEDIDYFAKFVNDFVQNLPIKHNEYLKESVKYDQIICKAPLLALHHGSFDKINMQITNDEFSGLKDPSSVIVTKSPAVVIEKFNYNIQALHEGIDIKELKTQPSILAFIPLNSSEVEVCRLSPALKFIVEKAVTPISIDKLVREAASFQNIASIPEKFQQACISGIQKLSKKGILL